MGKKDDRTASQDKLAGREPGLSVVATGMRIDGRLDTNGVVKVEGMVSGSIRAERQVLVAKGGIVEGDILTREAVIGGEVRGAIYADERVEVQAGSQVNGDITTKRILLQEGGEVNGHLRMEDPKALAREPGAAELPTGDQAAELPTGDQAAELPTGDQSDGRQSEAEAEGSEAKPASRISWQPPVGQGVPND
jgi:cytoskeletal protein CcmA (bactofilin family)